MALGREDQRGAFDPQLCLAGRAFFQEYTNQRCGYHRPCVLCVCESRPGCRAGHSCTWYSSPFSFCKAPQDPTGSPGFWPGCRFKLKTFLPAASLLLSVNLEMRLDLPGCGSGSMNLMHVYI